MLRDLMSLYSLYSYRNDVINDRDFSFSFFFYYSFCFSFVLITWWRFWYSCVWQCIATELFCFCCFRWLSPTVSHDLQCIPRCHPIKTITIWLFQPFSPFSMSTKEFGFPFSSLFTMYSNLNEFRFDYHRATQLQRKEMVFLIAKTVLNPFKMFIKKVIWLSQLHWAAACRQDANVQTRQSSIHSSS